MIRAVLDVNVLVSSLIRPQGPPGVVLRLLAEEAFELVLSEDILGELRRAITYPRVRSRINLSDDEIELLLAALDVLAVHVEPTIEVDAVGSDPDDDVYIEAALEGRAGYVVTGDKHLLDLARYEDILIVRPAAFLRILESGSDR